MLPHHQKHWALSSLDAEISAEVYSTIKADTSVRAPDTPDTARRP
jgi:hypothetical protein